MHSNSGSSVSLLVDNNATVKAGGYCASGKASVPSHITPPARSYCEPLLIRSAICRPRWPELHRNNLEVTPKQIVARLKVLIVG